MIRFFSIVLLCIVSFLFAVATLFADAYWGAFTKGYVRNFRIREK